MANSVIIVESKNDVMFFKAVCKTIESLAENMPEFIAFDDNFEKTKERGLDVITLRKIFEETFDDIQKQSIEIKNDKTFFELVWEKIEILAEEMPEFEESDKNEKGTRGLSHKTLKTKLQKIFSKIRKKNIQKIGVLIDMDTYTNETRIDFVNNALKEAFRGDFEEQILEKVLEEQNCVTQVSVLKPIEVFSNRFVDFAYYFVNVNGKGELENLLFEIRTLKPSPALECLDSWRACIDKNNKEGAKSRISDKDFLKMQIDFYIRLDTCSKKEEGDRGRKCSMKNLDYILENKTAFNLKDPILDELKTFLKLFA